MLGVALASLMKLPAERRAELKALAMRRVASSGTNELRKYLLVETIEAYLTLNEEQARAFDAIQETDEMQEVRQMKNPWEERCRAEGRVEGRTEGRVEGNRRLIRLLLEKKFGPLPGPTLEKLNAAGEDDLLRLGEGLLEANSLADLGLDE